MTIQLNRTLIFDNLSELMVGRNTFQLVLQNGINQALCDLHFQTQNSTLGIPPLIVSIKVQTTFDAQQMILSPPSSTLDIDFQTFFNSHQCIPYHPINGFFLVTLTFNRTFISGDVLLVAPTNSQGNVVIA